MSPKSEESEDDLEPEDAKLMMQPEVLEEVKDNVKTFIRQNTGDFREMI